MPMLLPEDRMVLGIISSRFLNISIGNYTERRECSLVTFTLAKDSSERQVEARV
jgi:hypothetical protein